MVLILSAASCTGPQESLELDEVEAAQDMEPRYAGFGDAPHRSPPAPPPETGATAGVEIDTVAHYSSLPQPRGRVRRRDWDVMRDVVDELLGWDSDRSRCADAPPTLPALSADGRVLALGLTTMTARGRDATIRLVATESGALLSRKRLPRVRDASPMTRDDACAAAREIDQWLAVGDFQPMQEAVRTDSGIPPAVDPWRYVVANGATREKDGAYDILVVPGAAVEMPQLAVRPVDEDWGGDVSAWISDEVAVLTEYYVGC